MRKKGIDCSPADERANALVAGRPMCAKRSPIPFVCGMYFITIEGDAPPNNGNLAVRRERRVVVLVPYRYMTCIPVRTFRCTLDGKMRHRAATTSPRHRRCRIQASDNSELARYSYLSSLPDPRRVETKEGKPPSVGIHAVPPVLRHRLQRWPRLNLGSHIVPARYYNSSCGTKCLAPAVVHIPSCHTRLKH